MRSYNQILADLKANNLYRQTRAITAAAVAIVTHGGREYINFSSNDYLGLSQHPALKEAAARATQDLGTGAGASRLITGTLSLHEGLESELKAFKGTEAALVFNSGFQANTATIPAIANEGDVIFSDELNHASLIDGCRLSRAKRCVYPHVDTAKLRELLVREQKSRPAGVEFLIITESVFSMDGDLAPLADLTALAHEFDTRLYVDEAHATGVFGPTGRGLCEHASLDPRDEHLVQMGTFSKALGSFGAYIAGTRELIELLINRARGFIYSTALPPTVIAANLAALEVVKSEPELRKRLWQRVAEMNAVLCHPEAKPKDPPDTVRSFAALRMTKPSPSPIFPVIVGAEKDALALATALWDKGLWTQAIRPPTVPQGTSRLRLTVSAAHTPGQIAALARALKKAGVIAIT